jgi:hypothetical protein
VCFKMAMITAQPAVGVFGPKKWGALAFSSDETDKLFGAANRFALWRKRLGAAESRGDLVAIVEGGFANAQNPEHADAFGGNNQTRGRRLARHQNRARTES